MSASSPCNPVFALALQSAFRHCLRALLPLAAVLCLAAPAGAQAPVTPNASDKTALGRIKNTNDTNSQLSGANWTGSPITYSTSNGVIWNADSPARVSGLRLASKQLTGSLSAEGMAALSNSWRLR